MTNNFLCWQGDVSDLDLTFSVDEDIMGKIITHELVPGGRLSPVTNENRFECFIVVIQIGTNEPIIQLNPQNQLYPQHGVLSHAHSNLRADFSIHSRLSQHH